MAKKISTKRKSPGPKKAARKQSPARRSKTVTPTRAARKKTVRRKAARKKKSLGRAKVSADARLDVLFHNDYQAREVFDYLHVATIRELQQFAPQDIVEQMTVPLRKTVERIRKALALHNRCLAGDEQFALDFLEQWKTGG